jgi:hypothetical protein
VLGTSAFDAVRGLVDQSLLSVRETSAGVRYRMLETVREFGRMQLAGAGEDAAARAAQRRWAVGYAVTQLAGIMGPSQFAAIDALGAEETNLADELRGAIADGDRGSLVQLLAALGLFWTMRGEHLRLVALARAVAEAVRGWLPPPDLADAARAAIAVTLNNSIRIGGGEGDGPLMDLLRQLGPDPGGNVYLSGLVRVLLAYDSVNIGSLPHGLAADTADWAAGDPAGAIEAAQRVLALLRDEDGPWSQAMPHGLLAELSMHIGDRAAVWSRSASTMSGTMRKPPIVVNASADSATVVTVKGAPVKRPECSSTSRCAISESVSVS